MVLFEMMIRGGAVMWPILLCALLMIYVIVERWSVLRLGRFDASQFLLKVKSLYRHGDLNAALTYCSQKDAPLTNIVRRGLLKRGQGVADVSEVVENAAREEMFRFEKRLSLLASLSGVAPMLGFLGSIVGLIVAFQAIESKGGAALPADLAGGIWQALLTTAFGLVVGTVALIAHNGFAARVKRLAHDLESACNEFLELLEASPGENNGSNGNNGNDVPLAMRPTVLEEEPFRRKE